MAATPHSTRVYIAVDPVQDYEETLTILGVYGSLAAAQVAVRQMRARPDGLYRWSPERATEVQEWVGDEHRTTWSFHPASGWKGPVVTVEPSGAYL
ncbi:hypothetical protein [Micromonospora sp. CB01531]|uniref:hypothetical protein n=1 Tax=Micromonospora sp. CB01531 TaxID=1718947 RepID=UPI0009397BDC|nr:hypothetical protein [Micromonospora sp. CB01531]OKI47213.1 hypothetical protein A6A27_10200 [Micromonospora sp. CB01531]